MTHEQHVEAIRAALAHVDEKCPGWSLSGRAEEGMYVLRAWVGYNGAAVTTSDEVVRVAAQELIQKLSALGVRR